MRHRAAGQELRREARHVARLVELAARIGDLSLGHRAALAGIDDGVGEQAAERQRAAPQCRQAECRLPAGNRTGNGQRRQRPARWNRIKAPALIKGHIRQPHRRTAGINGHRRRAAVMHQPEAIAAKAVHVRIDDGNGRRRRHHRLDRVAAIAQHAQSGLRRQMMRRHHHAPGAAHSFKHLS